MIALNREPSVRTLARQPGAPTLAGGWASLWTALILVMVFGVGAVALGRSGAQRLAVAQAGVRFQIVLPRGLPPSMTLVRALVIAPGQPTAGVSLTFGPPQPIPLLHFGPYPTEPYITIGEMVGAPNARIGVSASDPLVTTQVEVAPGVDAQTVVLDLLDPAAGYQALMAFVMHSGGHRLLVSLSGTDIGISPQTAIDVLKRVAASLVTQ